MVNVSIVTYNTPVEELADCLRTLEKSVAGRVFVIDNSSRDDIREICSMFSKAEYEPSDNVGFGKAHNKALRRSVATDTEYHLVLNSDVRFESDIIEELARYMDEHEDVALVQPRVLNADGTDQYTCRMLPSPMNVFARRFLPKRISEKMDVLYLLKDFDHETELNVPYFQGSFLMLRVNALKNVGLFDERFFMYPEDIDISRRLHRKYRTMYYPYRTVTHDHRAASYHSMKMTVIHAANMMRYFNKWGWIADEERKRMNDEVVREMKRK